MSTMPAKWATSVASERPLIGYDMGLTPLTFNEALIAAVESAPNRVQYVSADGVEFTLADFYTLTRAVAKSCLHLGLARFEGAGIMGFNSVQWFAADVGVMLAGGVPAGIYTTNKPDIVAYILNHSDSRVLFVDDEDALQKALSCKERCPRLKAIVVWGTVDLARYADHSAYLYSWDSFLMLGADVPDADLDARIAAAKPENVAKLIYTSGTTGPPKAVMISHDNITFTVEIMTKRTGAGPDDHIISFLPCSHIAANLTDICCAILNGARVTVARPDALKGSLLATLRLVRPTVLIAVPRVYEKIQERLLGIGATSDPFKRAISTWAKSVGTQAALARDEGDDIMPWGYERANLLVFKNIRKALGLDRCKLLFTAAAPLQKATDDYFRSLDFRIYDMYGMSESTGALTCNYPTFRRGTSGTIVPGVEMKLQNEDYTGEGELCFRGRNVFVGYLANKEESAKTIDNEGFVHSGDLGRVDEDGFVTITGRSKELIVTAAGENVAPALVESSLFSALPAISRAFAVGDQRRFISCILVPYVDNDGKLTGPASTVNPSVTTAEEARVDAVWGKYVQDGIEKANEFAISNAAKVRKHTLISRDFSVDTGELTPTMKVKRKIVMQNFEAEIEAMYSF